ncbi:lipoate--protein ligase family protein [Halorussus gelatinilyticus]|uniref:Lipoate--protein ligase family protein n=1 Tax=Halorussus gelatinilyticus TaxID=2937524 RepID=A0A8U0INJ2_9EURY|nr:lipoate--protein ligase family protein [Halorussus gelatinilyticus]UPW02136.1 lipoate--protein ligase family protein [Halorussus gelatinilyticus]
MRVLRGRAAGRDADRDVVAAMLERAAETGEASVRVWRPHRQLAFGRRDSRADDYEVAKKVADACDFPPVERSVGGRAVAYTGNTVAFANVVPLADMRVGMDDRYEETTRAVQRALWRLGVPASRGEPEASFCPGDYSLQRDGKLVGVAQRVRKNAALVSGVVVVRDREEIAGVLDPVYAALDVPFDPDSVGSVAGAGGDGDPERVARTIEDLLVGDRPAEVEHVGDAPDVEPAD